MSSDDAKSPPPAVSRDHNRDKLEGELRRGAPPPRIEMVYTDGSWQPRSSRPTWWVALQPSEGKHSLASVCAVWADRVTDRGHAAGSHRYRYVLPRA